MVAGSLLLSTLVCILLWRLDVGCVCMMFSELLMFGVAFKGFDESFHFCKYRCRFVVRAMLWVPFLDELQA